MSYECEPIISYINRDGKGEIYVDISLWSGYIPLIENFYTCEILFIKPIENWEKQIERVKNFPCGPKYWPIGGMAAQTFNSNYLPYQYENSIRFSWEKFAFASAQIAENYLKQLNISESIIQTILNPFICYDLKLKFNDEEVIERMKNNKDLNLKYIGELIGNALEAQLRLEQENK